MTRRGDFWSRRKAAVAAEARAEEQAARGVAGEGAVQDTGKPQKSDGEILAKLNLPDPDSLRRGDDFTAFMADAVPEHLRRRALRRLWVSDPVLANLDNLVEYGEDYTDGATVVEALQTAYEVGKGMVARLNAAVPAPPAADPPAAIAEMPALAVECQEAAPLPALQQEQETQAEEELPEPTALPPGRRRMRFTFAEPAAEAAG